MFPPELDPKRGHEPRRVRRIGRRGRPVSMVVAILLCTAFWGVSLGLALWGVTRGPAGDRTGTVLGIAFWTLVFALLMWRVWCGGRKAITFVAGIGTMLGIVYFLGAVAFTVLMFVAPPGGSIGTSVAFLLPAPVAGGALLAAGILLRRREVAEWSGF